MSTTVRISQASLHVLREIAAQAGEPMQAVLDRAIEAYRRQCLLQKANEAYAALKEDPAAWQKEMAERKVWDATLADGQKGDDQ